MDQREVYVVTSGYYSDKHIVGIYTDGLMAAQREALERESEVETHTLNPLSDQLREGLTGFEIHMGRDGRVMKIQPEPPSWMVWETPVIATWPDRPDPYMKTHIWAKDADHAVKIANERRSRLIASNQWETENDDN